MSQPAQTEVPATDEEQLGGMPPIGAGLLSPDADLDAMHTRVQGELEAIAEELRLAVLGCDAKQLIGFLWGQLLIGQKAPIGELADTETQTDAEALPKGAIEDVMCALEYVHAVLSSHREDEYGTSTEADTFHAVLSLSVKLRMHSMVYCFVAARRMPEGLFGPETGTIAMQAMTSWVSLRGHRFQALEAEFFEFVFEPHDEALRSAYGIGAKEVAAGIQAAVDATRFGHMRAAELAIAEMNATYDFAESQGIELQEAIAERFGQGGALEQGASSALEDLFFGGICNVTKSSGLPSDLLADLTYQPGEEKEFFAVGPLRGTPLLRMPGRVKPLVAIAGSHYTCDANFMRVSTYRALQWGLLKRVPTYKQEWLNRQTALTEGAFARILSKQLVGATVFTSVYYQDPDTGKWVENDVLILLDDVLLQLEVKAGVMPMHSPDLHFERHVRTIQELVVKAHHQCERFLRYAASADEVPLYRLVNGNYDEVHRLRLAKYRVVLPIGLTVEAFTPFSSMSKRLPQMQPILGKHPFVSMSIDDLFVLARFLPTTGELMHYLSVRQAVAGIKDVMMFDELDHLGSYLRKNRSDKFYLEQLSEGTTWIHDADTSAPIEDYFADPDWETNPPPTQNFPATLEAFLAANDAIRGPRFLEADAMLRDRDGGAREQIAMQIDKLLPTLDEHPYRWFSLVGDEPLMVWVQRSDYVDFKEVHKVKAEATAISAKANLCKVLMVYVKSNGQFDGGWARTVSAPTETDARYGQRFTDASKLAQSATELTPGAAQRLLGRST